MGSFSIWHWLILLAIILLVFGTKRLRNIGSDVGSAIRDFRKSMDGKSDSEDEQQDESAPLPHQNEASDSKRDKAEASSRSSRD